MSASKVSTALGKALAAPIIIPLKGKNALARFYFFKGKLLCFSVFSDQ